MADDIVYMFHYSSRRPYKCKILEDRSMNTVNITVLNKKHLIKFSVYDPIAFCVSKNGDVILDSGNIEEIHSNDSYKIKLDFFDKSWNEKREYERYPVSLYA
ncbi:MAG TPA: hypothetical protein VF941_10305, partial [Clostridia bacterium]